MKSRLAILLFCALSIGCSGFSPRPISRFELQTPRPFGYLIGDEIRHRVVVETGTDMSLNLNSVPKQGEVNRWLNLNRVKIETDAETGDTVIDLVYQVFYAPNEVKMLSVPGFSLQFNQAGKTVEQAVPAWSFSLSPIKELAVRKDEGGLNYMRPDALPMALPTQNQRLGLYASLTLALFTAGYLAYLYGYFPVWPKRRIFKRAAGELSRLSERELERGLAVIHHALNTLNGRPLFKHKLSDFYQAHPEYQRAAESMEWFFNFSNQVLFAGRQSFDGQDWRKLNDLCRLCRDIECGRL
ncbi:MAG: nonribosomal peptide synthetase MxaA [Methylococcaceae bacterium]|nr:nonribosomal peptide synthetase MxaA [Methylococcaceae bacterium]